MISAKQVQAVSRITGMFARAFTIGAARYCCEFSGLWKGNCVGGIQAAFAVKGDVEGYIVANYSTEIGQSAPKLPRIEIEPKLAAAILDVFNEENERAPDPCGFRIALDSIECRDVNSLLFSLRTPSTLTRFIIQIGNYRVEFYVTKLSNAN